MTAHNFTIKIISLFENQRWPGIQMNKLSKDNLRILDLQDYCEESPIPVHTSTILTIALINQDCVYHVAGKSFQISGPALMFLNPDKVYRFEQSLTKIKGGVCIFHEPFFSESYTQTIRRLPIFNSDEINYYHLERAQSILVEQIFHKIKIELQSDYVFKLDLIRTYVIELIHYGMKMHYAIGELSAKLL